MSIFISFLVGTVFGVFVSRSYVEGHLRDEIESEKILDRDI